MNLFFLQLGKNKNKKLIKNFSEIVIMRLPEKSNLKNAFWRKFLKTQLKYREYSVHQNMISKHLLFTKSATISKTPWFWFEYKQEK